MRFLFNATEFPEFKLLNILLTYWDTFELIDMVDVRLIMPFVLLLLLFALIKLLGLGKQFRLISKSR